MFDLRSRLLTLAWFAASASALQPAHGETLLIRNAHVISGERPQPGALQNLLLRDGVIARMGHWRGSASKVIDAKGGYLIPGLIDTHVHLGDIPGVVPGAVPGAGLPEDVMARARAQVPRSYLYFGFTTLLDLVSDADSAARWNSQRTAPRALYCVATIVPGGYPLALMDGAAQLRPPFANFLLFDDSLAANWPASLDREQHRPAALVARARNEGATCIKTVYETGFGPKKNLPVPSIDTIKALVAAAHAAKMKVYMHGNSEAAHRFAIAAGVDVIAHGLWHSDSSEAELARLAAAIRDSGTVVQPTIQVLIGERELFNQHFFDSEHARATIPADLRSWYRSEAGQWMNREMTAALGGQGHVEDLYSHAKASYATLEQRVRNMIGALSSGEHSALRFGSDTPSGPFYTQFPGLNGFHEIQSWAEAGVTPVEIFRALTIDNAKLLALEKEIGQVKVGMRADLLILKANPLSSAAAYDSIETVILNGEVIDRNSLRARE